MDSITAINIVKNYLRENLNDPYSVAGGSRASSSWVFSDEPHTAWKYPQIEIKKFDNPSEPIDIGSNYMEFEQLFINIWFYTKNGFKISVSGTEYSNAQLVEYYQSLIKTTFKSGFNTLHDSGVKMYKHLNTSQIGYDKDTQLYFGNVIIRVAYFNR